MRSQTNSEVIKSVKKLKKVIPKPERIKKLKKACDDLASLVVRTRDGFICQHCLDRYKKGLRDEPQPSKYNGHSHILTRSNFATRWLPLNGITLCFRCHLDWGHRQPKEFLDWEIEFLGEDNYNELLRLSQQKAYTSEDYLIQVKDILKKQLEDLNGK